MLAALGAAAALALVPREVQAVEIHLLGFPDSDRTTLQLRPFLLGLLCFLPALGGLCYGFARWPGRIKAGSVSDHPSAFWDFLPTACDVAGIDPPDKIDGISYLPELLGDTDGQEKHTYLYWPWAIRVGKWKLHPRGRDRFALYDLENDIGEKRDVAAEHPELVERYGRFFEEGKRPLR